MGQRARCELLATAIVWCVISSIFYNNYSFFSVHFILQLRYTRVPISNNVATYMALISHWLCYFNSAINPVIYNLMSGT